MSIQSSPPVSPPVLLSVSCLPSPPSLFFDPELSLSTAIQPTQQIMPGVLADHQSLFPCCPLLRQLLSTGLAHPRPSAADGPAGALRLEGYKGETTTVSGIGFSDCMWRWPKYLNCSEYFIFRNGCGVSVHMSSFPCVFFFFFFFFSPTFNVRSLISGS